jgi:hypothetical protein
MPSIEWTGIDLINISNQCYGVCLVPKWAPKSDRTICQATVPSQLWSKTSISQEDAFF